MARKLFLLLAAFLLIISCGPTPTPVTAVPHGYNSVSNLNVTSGAANLPVQCTNASGNVYFPQNSFSGSIDASIACISQIEQNTLDSLVKAKTDDTKVVLGAITLTPSPYNFDKPVTLTIPLVTQRPELANQYRDLYYYSPNAPGDLEELTQALIDSEGRTAQATVDHFSTFVLVGPAEGASEEPPVTEPPVTAPPVTEPPFATCDDPLGCVMVEPTQPILLAELLDFSGQGDISKIASQGIRAALKDFGPIAGHGVNLKSADSGCNAEGAQQVARQLVDEGGYAGVIGTICSSSARAAGPILSDAGLVMISPANTNTELTSSGSRLPGYFRVSLPDPIEAQVMARYAYEQMEQRYVAILFSASRYGRSMSDAFSKTFMEMGGKIVTNQEVPGGTSDYYAIISLLRENKAESVYLAMSYEDAGQFVYNAWTSELQINILAPSTVNVKQFYDLAGSGIYQMRYTDLNPQPIQSVDAYAYDATRLLLEAIARVTIVNPDGSLLIPRQRLRDAMYQIKFDGRSGTIYCSDLGDCGHPLVVVYSLSQGQPINIFEARP